MNKMITAVPYAYWHRALKLETAQESRDTDVHIEGFWRIVGAKTKPDYPVAIWPSGAGEDPTKQVLKIGRKEPLPEGGTEWFEFIGGSFTHCDPVTKAAYDAAIASGFWADGKPSRKVSAEEKLDLIPDTAAEDGGNAEGALPYEQQINTKMQKEIAKRAAIGRIDSADKATKAAEVLEAIRGLGKLGNARREADRAPHLTAAQAVQNVWLPILTPGSELVPKIVADIKAFQDAEQARLQREADEAARVERARLQAIKDDEARIERARLQKIADEENERIRAENAKRTEEAYAGLAIGDELGGIVDLIDEVAAPEVIAEQVEIVAEQVAVPKVSSAYGRAVSKPKLKKGRITDRAKFIKALAGQTDFEEWLAEKANRLARANTELKGMEIYVE